MPVSTITNGFSDSGPLLSTQDPFDTTGAIFYVNSVTGNDTNAGTSRKAPKATIFGASGGISVTTAASGDVVVCESTHRETISAAYTFSKSGVRVWSDGVTGNRAIITIGVAAGIGILVSGNYSELNNFEFPVATAAATAKISITGAGNQIRGCGFHSGSLELLDQLLINAGTYSLIQSCQFTVDTVAASAVTCTGITMTGAALGNRFYDCGFDGGSGGWTQTAFSIEGTGADGFDIQRLTLANNSWLSVVSGSNGNVSGIASDTTSGRTYVA